MNADQVAFIAIPVLVGLALLFTAVSLLRRGSDGRGRSVRVRDVARPAEPAPPPAPADLRPEQAGAVVLDGVTPTTEIVQYSGDVPAEIDEPVYRIVVEELSEDEKGVTRRMFFNRAITGFMSVGLGSFGLAMLMFLWPSTAGGFGSKITTNRSIADIKASLEGRIQAPVYFPDARVYVLPWTAPDEGQFEGRGVIVDGLTALYQRCVHLGCRVPWCSSSQGFECPCHGSKYNRHGEYVGGPAPRNLDRFRIAVTATGFLEIDTALPVETPRAPRTTVEYPQGPNCL